VFLVKTVKSKDGGSVLRVKRAKDYIKRRFPSQQRTYFDRKGARHVHHFEMCRTGYPRLRGAQSHVARVVDLLQRICAKQPVGFDFEKQDGWGKYSTKPKLQSWACSEQPEQEDLTKRKSMLPLPIGCSC